MHPRNFLPLVFLLGLAIPATAAVPPIPVGTPPAVDPPRDPAALQTRWRWIGVAKPERTCPEPISDYPADPDDWTLEPLFADAETGVLERFCVYESGKDNPSRPPFHDDSALRRLDPDFMGVMPSAGGALDAALSQKLIDQFRSQAGGVALPLVPGQAQTRLAILDTAPTTNTGAENTSVHGITLLHLARGLLCDAAGQCTTRVTSRLAMSWECFDGGKRDTSCRNPVNGGLYGLAGELARAIHLETRDWRSEDPEKKLVINLSTGWDPILGGLDPMAEMPAPALAVHVALEHAVCAGAVVMAAAGNRTGGPTDELGPLLPAAWEQHAGPSPARCTALGVPPTNANFPTPGTTPYRRLVHAVGGVRANDGPLFNARLDGEPRLVAFGDHGKGLASTGDPTATLSGSSVATLVAAAAAAAAWYYDDTLEPYQVPSLVYDGGRALGRTSAPAFCPAGGVCPTVRRASVCDAVVKAGGLPAGSCPPLPLPALTLVGADLAAFKGASSVSLDTLKQRAGPFDVCRDERRVAEDLHVAFDAPTDPCPHRQYYPRGPERVTKPQPGAADAICTTCALDEQTSSLYIAVDGDFDGTVKDGVLKCGADTFALGLPELGAGDTWLVTDVECAASDPVQVSFTIDGDASATAPILVVP